MVQKRPKKPQNATLALKAPLLETLFVYVLLMTSGCQNKVETREILNNIFLKNIVEVCNGTVHAKLN